MAKHKTVNHQPWLPGYWVYDEGSHKKARRPQSGPMLVSVAAAEAYIRRARDWAKEAGNG